MAYSFQSRLHHASRRFKELNSFCMTYTNGTLEFPIDASPILVKPDEFGPPQVSLARIERQDFVVDVCDLGAAYPPKEGHRLTNISTGEVFTVQSLDMDTPPYSHVTSDRTRVIIHTIRRSRG